MKSNNRANLSTRQQQTIELEMEEEAWGGILAETKCQLGRWKSSSLFSHRR